MVDVSQGVAGHAGIEGYISMVKLNHKQNVTRLKLYPFPGFPVRNDLTTHIAKFSLWRDRFQRKCTLTGNTTFAYV
jgi:hypothetical protein